MDYVVSVLAVVSVLFCGAIALVRRSLYDRVESVVWRAEDWLSAGFERLTGGGRRTLRYVIIALVVLGAAVVMGLTAKPGSWESMLGGLGLIVGMLLLSFHIKPHADAFVRSISLGAAVVFLVGAAGVGVAQYWRDAVFALGCGLFRLTDFIYWAEHRRPRKRRVGETLPEAFRKKIEEAGLAAAPEKA